MTNGRTMKELLEKNINDLKADNPQMYCGSLQNYRGETPKCVDCNNETKDLSIIYMVDLANDGTDTYIFCNENCFVSYNESR